MSLLTHETIITAINRLIFSFTFYFVAKCLGGAKDKMLELIEN
jgi:hypothetical protein